MDEIEKAIRRSYGKSRLRKSHDAFVEAGKPPRFRYDHKSERGMIIEDSPMARRRRRLIAEEKMQRG